MPPPSAPSSAQPPAEPPATLRAEPHAAPFSGFVVGIGASAGGLDALERLFGALPPDTGAAFVVVQHLSPDHKSMMDNLLARYTRMPVRVAAHDMPLAADTVFLIPPAKEMRLAGGRLQLAPKPEHGLSLPIDVFFTSLAEQCADRAFAVVLSGTGSDGSRGVGVVNAGGGFVFVQEPGNARFDGMPRSAVATGLADVVAPAEELAARLVAHLRAPRGAMLRTGEGDSVIDVPPLEAILDRLELASGIDFRHYKPTTVLRRIERRMQVLRADSLAAYLERMAAAPEEPALLRRELLIPVTRFFRDPEVFEQLATEVVQPLLQHGSPQGAAHEPVRVWVACCATGEEAYSIAILFAEAAQRAGAGARQRPVKIFATDVEPHYVEQAAAGHYPDTIAAEVSPRRLEQFFVERPGGYTVRPEIRQMVIFARHNLLADPPFTRMDLATCRNALIYFEPAAQEQALRRLQYALVPGGALLLGGSETIGALHRDFAALGRGRLYRMLRRERRLSFDPASRTPVGARLRERRAPPLPEVDNEAIAQRLLLSAYAPPSLLLGPGREVLHVVGRAREWLQLPEGEATLDVLKLLPRELAWPASLLLQALLTEGVPQHSGPLRIASPDGMRSVRLVARLAAGDVDLEGAAVGAAAVGGGGAMTLLSFEDLSAASDGGASSGVAATPALDDAARHRIETLEHELELTHDHLQATIEELETANEELQATNEELMASNEELQSTNEELQSVNEELYTVNAEFQEKVDVLNGVNADLENVVRASGIPTLFIDEGLHLVRFTPELAQIFKVRESDRGRSIEDFAHVLDYPELFADLRRTLVEGRVCEREVTGRGGGPWWLARIQPYAARGTGGRRAVMTFVDISSLKDVQRQQAVIDSLAEHVAVVDANGVITQVNAAWRQFAADNGDPQLQACGPGMSYLKVCAQSALSDPDARAAFEGLTSVLENRTPRFTLQYPCHTARRRLWFLMHVAPVVHPAGGAVVSHIDVTPWVETNMAAEGS